MHLLFILFCFFFFIAFFYLFRLLSEGSSKQSLHFFLPLLPFVFVLLTTCLASLFLALLRLFEDTFFLPGVFPPALAATMMASCVSGETGKGFLRGLPGPRLGVSALGEILPVVELVGEGGRGLRTSVSTLFSPLNLQRAKRRIRKGLEQNVVALRSNCGVARSSQFCFVLTCIFSL